MSKINKYPQAKTERVEENSGSPRTTTVRNKRRNDLKRKRREAEERQAVYDGLSSERKFELIEERRGESKREKARLQ